jgi:hypothetical protein
MDWLSPTDVWPTHSRPEAQKALLAARAAGFWFAKLSAHAFGKIRCDSPDSGREIRKAIRNCNCERGLATERQSPTFAEDQLVEELRVLAQLTAAGLHLCEEDRAHSQAELAVNSPDEFDATDRFDRATNHADSSAEAAHLAAAMAGRGHPWPPARRAEELLTELVSRMGTLETTVDQLAAGRFRESFAPGLTSLRVAVDELRSVCGIGDR